MDALEALLQENVDSVENISYIRYIYHFNIPHP